MSIEVRTNKGRNGKPYKTYRVRYLDGAKHRSETFRRLQDAKAFEGSVIERKNTGRGIPTRGRQMTVRELGAVWFEKHVIPNKAKKTQVETAAWWDRLVLPELGDHRLRELTPERLEEWVSDLRSATGVEGQRKTIFTLQSAMNYAVRLGWIAHNNLLTIEKPKPSAPVKKRPPSPRQIELMRSVLLRHDHLRDATILSVLAYAGLRPGECLALRWSDVGAQTISVSRAISLGDEKDTKTHRDRVVRLLEPLRDDLDAWRSFSSPEDDDALIFPRRDGQPWRDEDYRNWRKRVFYEARSACAKEAAFATLPTPYSLRAAFVSLLLDARENPVVIAEEAGHNVATLFKHYAQVIQDLRGAPSVEPNQAIRAARLPNSSPKSNVTTRYRNTKVRRLQVENTNSPS